MGKSGDDAVESCSEAASSSVGVSVDWDGGASCLVMGPRWFASEIVARDTGMSSRVGSVECFDGRVASWDRGVAEWAGRCSIETAPAEKRDKVMGKSDTAMEYQDGAVKKRDRVVEKNSRAMEDQDDAAEKNSGAMEYQGGAAEKQRRVVEKTTPVLLP